MLLFTPGLVFCQRKVKKVFDTCTEVEVSDFWDLFETQLRWVWEKLETSTLTLFSEEHLLHKLLEYGLKTLCGWSVGMQMQKAAGSLFTVRRCNHIMSHLHSGFLSKDPVEAVFICWLNNTRKCLWTLYVRKMLHRPAPVRALRSTSAPLRCFYF